MAGCRPRGAAMRRGRQYRHDTIRLAYLSAAYRDHATSHLMAGLWELHDRHRFEITAISLGPDDKSAMRRRVVAAFDRFVEAGGRSDREIAGLLRNHEVDIAIDLGGVTTQCAPGILAHRPAPEQASYPGSPRTPAAPAPHY